MYHALGGPRENGSRYILSAASFRRQLRWLRRRGYRVISLDDYAACRRDGRLPPAKSVVITFDDGYADNLDRGLPPLQEAGFGAHLFVVAGKVGGVTVWPPPSPLDGRQLLTWEQVDELRHAGVEIGAHTMSHPKLRDLQPDEARWEIGESRSVLERRLEAPVSHFAYPYGNTSAEVQKLVREAGFETACGIQEGPNGHAVSIHELRRVEVRGTWSLLKFALAVRLGFEPRILRR
jgi:peptidoglycan/xylan/chitin deacetylase (PgdA/CDA1 family)